MIRGECYWTQFSGRIALLKSYLVTRKPAASVSVNEMKKIFPPAMTSPQVWISFMLTTTDFVQRTQDFPDFYIALVLTQFHRQTDRQTDRFGYLQ